MVPRKTWPSLGDSLKCLPLFTTRSRRKDTLKDKSCLDGIESEAVKRLNVGMVNVNVANVFLAQRTMLPLHTRFTVPDHLSSQFSWERYKVRPNARSSKRVVEIAIGDCQILRACTETSNLCRGC